MVQQWQGSMKLLSEEFGRIEALPLHAFEPFTKSQVFLVNLNSAQPAAEFSKQAILKIFDPKFLDDRQTKHPWNAEAEAEAVKRRQAGAYETWDSDFMFADDFVDGTEGAAAMWEEHFYRQLQECYTFEIAAYDRLRPFQGHQIPRIYARGVVNDLPERALRPSFILMEHIADSQKLSDISSSSSTSLDSIAFDLCHAVDQFAALGVAHTDIHKSNVLLRPDRAVLIDFGCAAIRSPDADNDPSAHQKWATTASFYGDSAAIRRVFGLPNDA